MNVRRFLYICDPKGVVTRKEETGARGEIDSIYMLEHGCMGEA